VCACVTLTLFAHNIVESLVDNVIFTLIDEDPGKKDLAYSLRTVLFGFSPLLYKLNEVNSYEILIGRCEEVLENWRRNKSLIQDAVTKFIFHRGFSILMQSLADSNEY